MRCVGKAITCSLYQCVWWVWPPSSEPLPRSVRWHGHSSSHRGERELWTHTPCPEGRNHMHPYSGTPILWQHLQVRVHRNPHNPGSRERGKVAVSKLLGEGPGYEVPSCSLASRERPHHRASTDAPLQAHLHHMGRDASALMGRDASGAGLLSPAAHTECQGGQWRKEAQEAPAQTHGELGHRTAAAGRWECSCSGRRHTGP